MTSLVAVFIALWISGLLFPYCLSVENKANRGNFRAFPRTKWTSGPSQGEPRCPREHITSLGFCLETRGRAGPLLGTEMGSSAQSQGQNMAKGKIMNNHKSAWFRYKAHLNVCLFLAKKSLFFLHLEDSLSPESTTMSWLWVTADREEK